MAPAAGRALLSLPELGEPMGFDHRRILATAITRLRAKLKYRPVVFELMPESFTLFDLQRAVEALAGLRLHKQNFRRLIEQQGLVEETGKVSTETGGRPKMAPPMGCPTSHNEARASPRAAPAAVTVLNCGGRDCSDRG